MISLRTQNVLHPDFAKLDPQALPTALRWVFAALQIPPFPPCPRLLLNVFRSIDPLIVDQDEWTEMILNRRRR